MQTIQKNQGISVKKFMAALLALILFAGTADYAQAQNKQLERAQKKEYKAKMREFKKGGWQIFGTSHTLDVALLTHYDRLAKEGAMEVVGLTTSTNKNIGKEKGFMSAATDYAKTAGSNIKGRIVEDMGSVMSTEEMEEFEHFYAAYENAVQKEIKGELQYSYAIYRVNGKTPKGQDIYEFQFFYVMDESAATKARIRAFENAAKESAAAQKYAEQVSKFINEGF